MSALLSKTEFETIARIAYERWGLNLTERKVFLVANRLASFLRKTERWSSPTEYLSYIDDGASEEDRLIFFDILSTNVTSFFRDPQHFEFLEREFYTALDRGSVSKPGRRIRIWSAACSNGCEPYSIGIHAMETLKSFDKWDFKILATDLSNSAIAHAEAGQYSERMIAPVPAKIRSTYFRQVAAQGGGQVYEVASNIRRMVTIRRRNLMEAMKFRYGFDAIFCRNVMIYFDAATRQQVVSRLASCLNPGGFLIVGSAESLSGLKVPFETIQPSVYRRV